MDLDLSEQLKPRPVPLPAAAPSRSSALNPGKGRSQAARLSMRATAAASAERGPSTGSYARMPPRANEEKRWKRSSRFNAPVRAAAWSCGRHCGQACYCCAKARDFVRAEIRSVLASDSSPAERSWGSALEGSLSRLQISRVLSLRWRWGGSVRSDDRLRLFMTTISPVLIR